MHWCTRALAPSHRCSVFGGTALVASLLGTHLSRLLVQRCGRASVLVFAFVGLLVAATALTLAFPAREAAQQLADGTAAGFTPLCK